MDPSPDFVHRKVINMYSLIAIFSPPKEFHLPAAYLVILLKAFYQGAPLILILILMNFCKAVLGRLAAIHRQTFPCNYKVPLNIVPCSPGPA